MKKTIIIITCFLLVSLNTDAGNFFKDLEKLTKTDKIKDENYKLKKENAELKKQLEQLSKFKYVNICSSKYGTKVYELRDDFIGVPSSKKTIIADFGESRNIDKIVITDTSGNTVEYQAAYFDRIFNNWVNVMFNGQNVLTSRIKLYVGKEVKLSKIEVFGNNI